MESPRWEQAILVSAAVSATVLGMAVVAYGPQQPWGQNMRIAGSYATRGISFPREITVSLPGLTHVIEAAPGMFSGSVPQGRDGFASLQKLKVQTIVSVDGAAPNVELAREYGLQYVHIPLGYDGVPPEAVLKLTAVVSTTKGPWYVHCHHGRHRGPAAAAIACRAAGLLNAAKADQLLLLAKTGAEYPGLWRDVHAFVPVPQTAKLPELVESAKVRPLVEAMVGIAERFERVKQEATDGETEQARRTEAVLLLEEFREALRLLDDSFNDDFRQQMSEAVERVGELATALAQPRGDVPKLTAAVEQLCQNCHVKFRNERR